MALFLYFSVILSQAKIFVERLGDRKKGLGATVWLGGSSFLCRRKLLPLQGDGSCRTLPSSWGQLLLSKQELHVAEKRESGNFIPGAVCSHISAPFPARPSWIPSLQHQVFWLRTRPCPGLLYDYFLGGS